MAKHHRSFTSDFRRFFGRGMGVLLPSLLTLWILWQASVFLFKNVALPINRGIRIAVVQSLPTILPDSALPGWYRISDEQLAHAKALRAEEGLRELPDDGLRAQIRQRSFREFWEAHWYMEATGLAVAILLIYLAGVLLGGLIGRKVYARIELLIARVPGFKQVYPHVKQVVDLILGDRPTAFKRVIMVEYPRKGIWTVGLVTGRSLKTIHKTAKTDCVSIFIPSTPTPFTGFTITVPASEVIDLPISVDEAIRFFITGGVLVPERESLPGNAQDDTSQTPTKPDSTKEVPEG